MMCDTVTRTSDVPRVHWLSCVCPPANFFLTMLRQHSQYDSRLGFSFRVLVRVRVMLGLG